MKIVPQSVHLVDFMGSDLSTVNAARTKTQQRIISAHLDGYRVIEGEIKSPYGKTLKISLYGNQKYPTFTYTGSFKKPYGIPCHQFAAYCYFGERSFTPSLVIRHLDGNTLNFHISNIRLGTHSQNNLDKSKEIRQSAAKKARASQGTTPLNAKLSPKQVQLVRDFYSTLKGKKAAPGSVQQLGLDLGVTRTTLNKIKNGKYYENF